MVWTIGRATNCLDAHVSQIVCDKDGVVDWCIVLVEMPLTRFEECWPPVKSQHSNPNPNPLANQLWCIDFLTPPTPLIISHRLPAFLESLMPLKNRWSIHARWSKSSLKHSIRFCGIFPKFKTQFYWISSILLYGCTTWTLTKRLEKKLDGNYTRMLRAILNKSWQQHPTRHQLYGHLPPITKTIQVRRTRHAGHCWRSRDELIRDVLLWIPTHGRAKAGRPARTYIQQLCEDTGCCPEDLPRAMNDREEWRERVRDIRATSTIWWWWWKCHIAFLKFTSCDNQALLKCIPTALELLIWTWNHKNWSVIL